MIAERHTHCQTFQYNGHEATSTKPHPFTLIILVTPLIPGAYERQTAHALVVPSSVEISRAPNGKVEVAPISNLLC